jgi:hypothetical protein
MVAGYIGDMVHRQSGLVSVLSTDGFIMDSVWIAVVDDAIARIPDPSQPFSYQTMDLVIID